MKRKARETNCVFHLDGQLRQNTSSKNNVRRESAVTAEREETVVRKSCGSEIINSKPGDTSFPSGELSLHLPSFQHLSFPLPKPVLSGRQLKPQPGPKCGGRMITKEVPFCVFVTFAISLLSNRKIPHLIEERSQQCLILMRIFGPTSR